jgi:tRNA pseudouridine38-40 synthase
VRPHAVTVLRVACVADNFDARRSARGRVYRYRILNRRAPAAMERGRVWHVGPHLDVAAMRAGALHLMGSHDFTSFRDSMCQARSPIKSLDLLDIVPHGEEIVIEARARSFLHHQVRSMVGSLTWVGEGRWSPQDLVAALAARSRKTCGPVAPPEGLYLVAVDY